MSLELVEWAASWPLVLPYFDGKVPAGFPSPAEDYLETELDLTEYLVENKAATFMMRVDGDSMKDAGILDGDLLVWTVLRSRSTAPLSWSPSTASTRSSGCAVDRTAFGWTQPTRNTSPCACRSVRNCMCLAW